MGTEGKIFGLAAILSQKIIPLVEANEKQKSRVCITCVDRAIPASGEY